MFDDDAFLAEGFQADVFVAESRRSVNSLSELQQGLEDYIAKSDNALVNIINNDYAAFLKLSSMLVDIDALVAGLRQPLNQLEGKVVDVRNVVQEPLEAQEDLLAKLSFVQEKKRIIKLCLSARETLGHVEKQVLQLQNHSSCDSEALGRASQRLARVAFLSQENQGLPMLRSIRAKARSLEHSLLEELDKALIQIARRQCEEDEERASQTKELAVVLRAYVAIDSTTHVGTAFKEKLVKPFLKELFTPGRVDGGGPRGGAKGLPELYREIISFINVRCRPIFDAINDPDEGLSQIDFVGDAIGPGVHESVKEHLESVFSSGDANTLLLSYRATWALFTVLTSLSKDPAKTENDASRTLDLWNLSVYVQLWTQSLFDRLDSALAKPVDPLVGENGAALFVTREVIACVESCWSEEHYLDKVGPQTFKLTLELLDRYLTWCMSAISSFSLVPKEDIHSVEASTNEGETRDDGQTPKQNTLVNDSGDSETAGKFIAGAFPDGVSPSLLAAVAADCTFMVNELLRFLPWVITKLYGARPEPEGEAAVRRAFTEILATRFEQASSEALASIESTLVKASSDALSSGLEGIPSMYRMTNKPMPTEPSGVSDKGFQPIEDFLQSSSASLLSEATRKSLLDRIFKQLVDLFASVSSRELQKVLNSEKALKRLNRGATNRAMDFSSDKIRVQYKIDLESMAAKVKANGASPTDTQGFSELVSELSPAP
eukprot:CAMPEP_0184508168 /NCGR_PEP_ID=MMETSP0198_2-20121128/619_1 /TAXON_ID=1112570 /ORGANISM="Thraustochytrium sp., Strain LLF1b" /LENGTH=719 /DNA_ID=CAMNT_0026897939 /DNA_START=204 /DNA_END=2363 /DNA_ORIENTATION=-